MHTLVALALTLAFVRPAEPGSIAARSSSDTCANVNSDLKVTYRGHLDDVGHINACLCHSTVTNWMLTSSVAQSAVALVGQAATETAIDSLISSSHPKSCSYPDHAQPSCSSSNPCGFSCADGYTAWPLGSPSQCICSFPKHECNGVCTSNSGSCPSQGPLKKRVVPVSMRARARCAEGFTPCGVPAGGPTWECVDTFNDLESCGGCVIPLGGGHASGVDCTALPGVADVACVAGTCVAHRCMPGYFRAPGDSFCLHSRYAAQLDEYVQDAGAYGLE
ncbi:hypothetical protein CERSUDRAFT_138560 [Gelatoporia subvermispora B]|uniref:Protein CPL1-like domain-containing protein n=1 Tax=Ceriporiopsis subvermispora (strain B) TaxID=914234 RepID=M2QFK2_CERS8|nr:hypothetical protein CERSUDRAFT_138560 [Gelatoporia subvermispora B]